MTDRNEEMKPVWILAADGSEREHVLVNADGSKVIRPAYTNWKGRDLPGGPVGIKCRAGSNIGGKNKGGAYPAINGRKWYCEERGAETGRTYGIHKLVDAAWNNDGVLTPELLALPVDHLDEDKTNNHYLNLERVTHRENQRRWRANRKTG